jgi:hypothetical protein
MTRPAHSAGTPATFQGWSSGRQEARKPGNNPLHSSSTPARFLLSLLPAFLLYFLGKLQASLQVDREGAHDVETLQQSRMPPHHEMTSESIDGAKCVRHPVAGIGLLVALAVSGKGRSFPT